MSQISMAKYADIGRRLRNIPLESHISSYEWEELIQKLCASDDAGLRDIGAKELYELLHKRPPSSSKQ